MLRSGGLCLPTSWVQHFGHCAIGICLRGQCPEAGTACRSCGLGEPQYLCRETSASGFCRDSVFGACCSCGQSHNPCVCSDAKMPRGEGLTIPLAVGLMFCGLGDG
jgi:hypothetical protein